MDEQNNNYYQQQAPGAYGQQAPPNYTQPGYSPTYTGYNVPNAYDIPPEIKKWNWGAFMFNWIWGIGNKAYLSLLCLVPCLSIVWIFVTGALGNQWAWKSGEFKDVESFLQTQRTWNRAGLVYFIVTIAMLLFSILIIVATGRLIYSMWNDIYDGYYYDYGNYNW